MSSNINILIVHYNTPYLTKHLVKSINKFTPGANVYIFDNSDTAPFDATGFDNVTVFDNTKGQYINFNQWLLKYPNRNKSNGRINGWGSAKHCISVEKCMSLINGNFILLDSDVLLKKDISCLWQPGCIYVGEVITQPRSTIKRVLPYICFINSEACKKNGIHYFDEHRMHGLMHNKIIKAADNYDTGAAFYVHCKSLPKKEIKVEEYVEHYSGASWKEVKELKYRHKLNPKEWIEVNFKYWGNEEDMKTRNKKVIYTCITGNYEPLDNPYAVSEGFDYICFTDSNASIGDMWQVRPIPSELSKLSNVKKQRCIKINPHKYLPEYELSIWVDGCIKLIKDVNAFISENCNGEENVYIPQHPQRKCIYEEMEACIKQKKDTAANIEPQKARYKKEKFPSNYGLVQSNIVIRKHNSPDCIRLMETWWNEVKNGSHRDQLSFDYARWKNSDVKVKMLSKTTCNSQYFKWDSSHGKAKKKWTPNTATMRQAQKPVTAASISEKVIVKAPAAKKLKPVTATHPGIRKKLISKHLKVFLRP